MSKGACNKASDGRRRRNRIKYYPIVQETTASIPQTSDIISVRPSAKYSVGQVVKTPKGLADIKEVAWLDRWGQWAYRFRNTADNKPDVVQIIFESDLVELNPVEYSFTPPSLIDWENMDLFAGHH